MTLAWSRHQYAEVDCDQKVQDLAWLLSPPSLRLLQQLPGMDHDPVVGLVRDPPWGGGVNPRLSCLHARASRQPKAGILENFAWIT